MAMENYETDEMDLYGLIEILIKQKLVVIVMIVLSIFASSFLAFKENKNFKAKNIEKFTEISKQELNLQKAEADLIEVENKIKIIIDEESKSLTTAMGISEFINLKYTTILREKRNLESEYNKERVRLENLKNPIKNKSEYIFGIVIVLGIILGIFAAFFKEFVEGYKERRK